MKLNSIRTSESEGKVTVQQGQADGKQHILPQIHRGCLLLWPTLGVGDWTQQNYYTNLHQIRCSALLLCRRHLLGNIFWARKGEHPKAAIPHFFPQTPFGFPAIRRMTVISVCRKNSLVHPQSSCIHHDLLTGSIYFPQNPKLNNIVTEPKTQAPNAKTTYKTNWSHIFQNNWADNVEDSHLTYFLSVKSLEISCQDMSESHLLKAAW